MTINSGTASAAATQQICVPTSTVVHLAATANPADGTTFEIGPKPWHKTAGDTGTGDPGTVTGTGASASSATTVTATGSTQCVYACCPFSSDGSGCSGTAFTAPCP